MVNVANMSLSEAAQQLWNADKNRLKPHQDYTINVQEGKKPFWKEDKAHDPLFTSVRPEVWQRPTYQSFYALLDNYSARVGVQESATAAEQAEVQKFLRLIMNTEPMKFCHAYCQAHSSLDVPEDTDGFIQLLHTIWFDLYNRERGGRADSSGFEHVFVGEVREEEGVSGFHNWIQFYHQEKANKVDYRGYLKPRGHNDAATNANDHILTLQFAWGGVEKFAGTFFVGVSPEFEMALYTLCFLCGEEENEIDLDTGDDVFQLRIKCYRMARDKIGTTFPEITSHYED